MRKSRGKGDYIAGFTSNSINKAFGYDSARMIYIMKVSEKMDYKSYFEDPRFQNKIPSDKTDITRAGDNIYKLSKGCYLQVKTWHHSQGWEKDIDMKSHQVLISDEFFYFGQHPLDVNDFNIKKPEYQAKYGVKTIDENAVTELWKYLLNGKKYKMSKVLRTHMPHHLKRYRDPNA